MNDYTGTKIIDKAWVVDVTGVDDGAKVTDFAIVVDGTGVDDFAKVTDATNVIDGARVGDGTSAIYAGVGVGCDGT